MTNICREVMPLADETVIYKNDASAFCEGTLEPTLAEGDIEWLIVAGVWTEACVAATVRDAIALGRRALIVKDACGSGTVAMHQTAVLNLANRLYGGAVTDTGSALRLLAGGEADVWRPERPVPILFDYATAARDYEAL
jgi:nicotinamidase-related amidase